MDHIELHRRPRRDDPWRSFQPCAKRGHDRLSPLTEGILTNEQRRPARGVGPMERPMEHGFNFQDVLASSARAAWQIEDVLPPGSALDFSRNFLPESLARTAAATALTPD